MAIPYPYVTDNPYHINTGSYLNKAESDMFVSKFNTDLWYGFSEADVIEVSAFDLNETPLGWQVTYTEKEYRTVSMTYLNTLDQPITYTYNELLSDFILYKNTKILVNPIEDVSASFGILSGSYILTYNFTREMAGQPLKPLVVKDISPSRKEVKLVPAFGNTPRFEAFCKKEFQIKEVAPLLIELTNQCPCDQIYYRVKDKYANEIAFLKQLFFFNTDGKFTAFLNTLYQDTITQTAPPNSEVKRVQGIRTYYQNYLLSNYEAISNFIKIDDTYNKFVAFRIEQLFKLYGVQRGEDFVKSKQFLIDFFTNEFYHQITLGTKASFEEKYFSYFKNALNLGNNQMFTIVDHAYMDERTTLTDPLTLLVKLKEEISTEVKIQTPCWISNISIAPFVVNAILRSPLIARLVKIPPPNFTLGDQNVSLYNVNQSYSATDLRDTTENQQKIDVNKTLNELRVDYTNFSNFVVFSSAAQRLVNFKNKIKTWYVLSSSLVTLEASSSQAISVGTVYPRYALEKGSIEGQMSDVVASFDGYESYLFNTGSYTYNAYTATFVSASHVADQDESASLYDKRNLDGLINNTPEHIILDSENDEYLMFLNMVGHFFDNLYLYITNLPAEKIVENDPTKTFSKKMIDYMLDSFGWKVGTAYEDLSVLQTYTTEATSSMSAEDRTKAVRTRILSTLPEIYKTKGTNEAIKLLLACYGVPSDLLEIREYGNNDYASSSLVTYAKHERSCMFDFSSSYDNDWEEQSNNVTITQLFAPRPEVRTVEFKAILKRPELYLTKSHYGLVACTNTYNRRWDVNWYLHNYSLSSIATYTALGYYSTNHSYPAWEVGFIREYGIMGRIYAVLPTYSSSLFYMEEAVPADSGSVGAFFVARISGSLIPNRTGSWIDQRTGSWGNRYGDTVIDGYSGSFYVASGSFTMGGVTGSFFKTASVLNVYSGSEISYGKARIYLTSSILPIFDGDVFNIRLRRNNPDVAFQYIETEDNVPTWYDLTVQRNESGRRVFRSFDVRLGTYEDNMIWDGQSINDVWDTTGSLGTTVTSSIIWGTDFSNAHPTGYLGTYWELGNAMVWDVPITDKDFEVHCNDFGSFAYSGSDGQKHLITRLDADEATNLVPNEYCYELIYPSASYVYGSANSYIPNKSEYYSTFYDRFGIPQQSGVVASGSWTGGKTGSLNWRESLTGSLKGSVTSSAISGSGHGYFVSESRLRGYFSGSLSGSFNGLASGLITGSRFTARGPFGHGKWTGSVVASEFTSQSYFSGSFVGYASGTFFGVTTGQMTSSQVGTFSGTRTTTWLGQLTGSVNGSIRAQRMTGSYIGHASASYVHVNNIGEYNGTVSQIWYGKLTGSLSGSFTGSTGEVVWSGSTRFIGEYAGADPYGYPYHYEYVGVTYTLMYDVATFSGSMKGVVSSSVSYYPTNTYPYASGSFSGSFIQYWTGSPVVLYNKTVMPVYILYGVDTSYYPLTPTRSSETWYCDNSIVLRFIESEYPYQFVVKDFEKVYTTPSYGPHRFKNQKIKTQPQYYDARLDDKDRSTYEGKQDNESDSNLVGLYLDPQDAKNRDIVKFFGNTNIIDLLADPSNAYSASYPLLQDANLQYNSFGDRKVLYNELITLYKIYFNRSIFDSVKNVVPARSNVRTGIVVEPTVLERPKYQHRPINTELNTGSAFYFEATASHYAKDPITKLVRFSSSRFSTDRADLVNTIVKNTSNGYLDLVYGEFNVDTSYTQSSFNTASIPANPFVKLDVSYINEANFIYPVNYNNGVVPDLMDNLQFGNYASIGDFPGFPEVYGVTTQENLDETPHPYGMERYFIVKKWDKHTIYAKSGSYSRSSSKSDDVYVTSSIWLYSLVSMKTWMYNQLFYTSNVLVRSGSVNDPWDIADDFIPALGYFFYPHRVNTAKKTPNERINTLKAAIVHPSPVAPHQVVTAGERYDVAQEVKFEVFCGYPRNHYIHKRMQYSPVKFSSLSGKFKKQTEKIYIRGSQTIDTTIDNFSGLEDASLPVQTVQTSNVNLVKSDNVINQ